MLEVFYEVNRKVLEVWKVETVEPNHWSCSWPASEAVIVPIPGRCQNHIAALHCDSLAVNGGEAALAFDDESHSESHMSMRWSCLVRHDELEAAVESVSSIWSILKTVLPAHLEMSWSSGLPREGLMSINTRRSACFSLTSSPARIKLGRISSYLQICGVHRGLGSGGLSFAICFHKGLV